MGTIFAPGTLAIVTHSSSWGLIRRSTQSLILSVLDAVLLGWPSACPKYVNVAGLEVQHGSISAGQKKVRCLLCIKKQVCVFLLPLL